MALDGIRKAAMVLMSLEAGTAAELLKSASPEVIRKIATEVAYLDAAGYEKRPPSADPVKEFFGLLGREVPGAHRGKFLRRVLASALGEQASQEVMDEVEEQLKARDPFLSIRSAGAAELASVMAGESAQAVAIVLAELPAGKSAELLSLMDENARAAAVCSMAAGESASGEARMRVARVVGQKLRTLSQSGAPAPDQGRREQKLRKVAVLLRGLEAAQRDALVTSIGQRDEEAANAVRDLMVLWEDLPAVADRSLQEALRGVEARKLALALVEADETLAAKVRACISERQRTMVDEETSLLSAPKREDIRQAREEILQVLREMNSKGELNFEEG